MVNLRTLVDPLLYPDEPLTFDALRRLDSNSSGGGPGIMGSKKMPAMMKGKPSSSALASSSDKTLPASPQRDVDDDGQAAALQAVGQQGSGYLGTVAGKLLSTLRSYTLNPESFELCAEEVQCRLQLWLPSLIDSQGLFSSKGCSPTPECSVFRGKLVDLF